MRINESYRLKAERYTLQGTINTENNEVNFPPRAVQPREVELYDFSQNQQQPAEGLVFTALVADPVK